MADAHQLAHAAASHVARNSYGKLVAYLGVRTRDLGAAQDALSDALEAALRTWPKSGVPDQPEAWIFAVARRKLTDAQRKRRTEYGASDHLRLLADELADLGIQAADFPDERLKLMFACAHPAIDARIRAPLILQTVLGFDAARIASAFLLPPATMGQRLVRAKTKIRQAGIPFAIPDRTELPGRLDAVLEAIYTAYSSGWSDPAGIETRRRELAEEAIWLGRLVAELLPDEPEALGLVALMLHLDARRNGRRTARGDYVPLADQDPALWDGDLIDAADALLEKAGRLGVVGRYQLEAAVQSAHADRRRTGRSDWPAIETLYRALVQVTGSPVVAINLAVVVAEVRGTDAGLEVLDGIEIDAAMLSYQPLWAARAELLARIGETENAARAYDRAIGLEVDPAVRRFLEERRAGLAKADSA